MGAFEADPKQYIIVEYDNINQISSFMPLSIENPSSRIATTKKIRQEQIFTKTIRYRAF